MICNATMEIYRGDVTDQITEKPLMEIPVFLEKDPDIVIHKGHTGQDFDFDVPAFVVISDEQGEIMRIDYEIMQNRWDLS